MRRKSFGTMNTANYDDKHGGLSSPPPPAPKSSENLGLLNGSLCTCFKGGGGGGGGGSRECQYCLGNSCDKLKVMRQQNEIKQLQSILNDVIAQRNALLCQVEQLKLQAVAGELMEIDKPTLLRASSSVNNISGNKISTELTSAKGDESQVEKFGTRESSQDLDQSYGLLEPEIEFSLICQDLIGLSQDDDSKHR